MSGRCDSCRYWKEFTAASKVLGELGNQLDSEWAKTIGGRWGRCERTEMSSGEAVDSLSLAVAQDGSDYAAHLETNEDFGCVQWKLSK